MDTKPKLDGVDAKKLEDLYEALQPITHTDLMKKLGMSKSTYYRILRREQRLLPVHRAVIDLLKAQG